MKNSKALLTLILLSAPAFAARNNAPTIKPSLKSERSSGLHHEPGRSARPGDRDFDAVQDALSRSPVTLDGVRNLVEEPGTVRHSQPGDGLAGTVPGAVVEQNWKPANEGEETGGLASIKAIAGDHARIGAVLENSRPVSGSREPGAASEGMSSSGPAPLAAAGAAEARPAPAVELPRRRSILQAPPDDAVKFHFERLAKIAGRGLLAFMVITAIAALAAAAAPGLMEAGLAHKHLAATGLFVPLLLSGMTAVLENRKRWLVSAAVALAALSAGLMVPLLPAILAGAAGPVSFVVAGFAAVSTAFLLWEILQDQRRRAAALAGPLRVVDLISGLAYTAGAAGLGIVAGLIYGLATGAPISFTTGAGLGSAAAFMLSAFIASWAMAARMLGAARNAALQDPPTPEEHAAAERARAQAAEAAREEALHAEDPFALESGGRRQT